MSRYHGTPLKRLGLSSFVLLSVIVLLCANTRTLAQTSGLALEVVEADLDPHTLAVNVELANHGKHTVAAYGITIITHYADGTETASHTLMDVSNALVSASVFGADPALKSFSKPFHPGDRRHGVFVAPNKTGGSAVSAAAFVTTEVFVDGTTQGPAEEIARIRQIWQQELDETRRWLPTLIQLRSSKSAPEDVRQALTKLAAMDGDPKSAHDASSVVRSTLKRNLTALAMKKNVSSPGDTGVAKLIELAEARATLLAHMLGEDQKGGKQ